MSVRIEFVCRVSKLLLHFCTLARNALFSGEFVISLCAGNERIWVRNWHPSILSHVSLVCGRVDCGMSIPLCSGSAGASPSLGTYPRQQAFRLSDDGWLRERSSECSTFAEVPRGRGSDFSTRTGTGETLVAHGGVVLDRGIRRTRNIATAGAS